MSETLFTKLEHDEIKQERLEHTYLKHNSIEHRYVKRDAWNTVTCNTGAWDMGHSYIERDLQF